MALYLVQHGKSLPKEEDPEKGLSDIGVAETRRIAEVASGYGVKVDTIRHSGKKRALQTAEILAEALSPASGVHPMDGIAPLDDVASVAPTLNPEENLMLVGHMPFMSRLASFLITGKVEPPVFRFQNSGIVCMVQPGDGGNWLIAWTLMPHIS